jgi:hypothetical protein
MTLNEGVIDDPQEGHLNAAQMPEVYQHTDQLGFRRKAILQVSQERTGTTNSKSSHSNSSARKPGAPEENRR